MVKIPDSVKSAWREFADDFNTDLGHTCRLIFDTGLTTDSSISTDDNGIKPRISLPLGGRAHGFSIPGHDLVEPPSDNHLKVVQNHKDITIRVYHLPRDNERYGINISKNETLYELVTNKKYIPDLIRADHIILYYGEQDERSIKVKSITDPIPYGMGDLHQCRSFWKTY